MFFCPPIRAIHAHRVSKEAPLPHSARSISFLNPDSVCFAYSPTEYAIFTISTMTAVDISTPLPTTASVGAMGAFSGLTGYMTLGLGAKSKPGVVHLNGEDTLILRDSECTFALNLVAMPEISR